MKLLLRYFGFKVFLGIVTLWLFIGMVVSILSLIEVLSRLADNENATFGLALKIMLIKMPSNFQLLLPFAMVMGTAMALLGLRRSNEFTIITMSGLRQRYVVIWVGLVAMLISITMLMLDGPIAQSKAQYRLYERNVLSWQNEIFKDTYRGLNFYHQTDDVHYYIYLRQFNSIGDKTGSSIIIVSDKKTGKLIEHIEAKHIRVLSEETWRLEKVQIYRLDFYELPIPISYEHLAYLARPLDTIGFFALPEFIVLAQSVGTQARLYQMAYWQKLLSPLFYAILAILAFGIIRLIPPRQATGLVILKCFLWALALNFGSNLLGALGSAEQMSLLLSLGAQLFLPLGIATIFLMQPGIR